ncbi:MAG: hypothetical protein Q4F72_10890, partial [Desulfovibrionaceae bacterium]|nr:hypothetical protein [Desulfovibrionaceae bacterium]
MSGYSFVSLVGRQIMGTLQHLLALLSEGREIASIRLLVSDEVGDTARRIEALCAQQRLRVCSYRFSTARRSGERSAAGACRAAMSDAERDGEKIIFNLDGGTNLGMVEALLQAGDFAASLALADRDGAYLYSSPEDKALVLPQPRELSPRALLALQGVEVRPRGRTGSERLFENECLRRKLDLPPDRLTDVRVAGQPFDFVWNMGGNRLALLHFADSMTQDNSQAAKALKLARTRALAGWATSRDKSGFYDRDVFGVTFLPSTEAQLSNLGGGKIRVIRLHEDSDDGWEEVQKAFRPRARANAGSPGLSSKASRTPVTVPDDCLVVVLGRSPNVTLAAINSHRKPNVVLCHTEDRDMQAMAGRVRNDLLARGLAIVRLAPCHITGFDLADTLGVPEHPESVTVNVSPGTKAQGAFLAMWARRHGCGLWAMEPAAGLVHHLRPGGEAPLESVSLVAADPLDVLRALDIEVTSHAAAAHENHPADTPRASGPEALPDAPMQPRTDLGTALQDALLDFMARV